MRRALTAAAVALAFAVAAPAALAQPTFVPWDGTNPFNCVLQQAGMGPTGPDPGADPYCVDFDKTHQNVTQLGIVQFLSLEPARVAAAAPKCFYFQSDHWRSYVIQGDGSTALYAWDGHYFYDKALGEGGVWVTNFSINGHTADPSEVPGMPADWTRDMGPGTAGVMMLDDIPVDLNCAARAARDPAAIYAGGRPPQPGLSEQPAPRPATSGGPCVNAGGRVGGRRLGPVAIGETDMAVRARLGDPFDVRDGFLVYCATGGGVYMVGELWDGVGAVQDEASAPTAMIMTTARAARVRGIGPGSRLRALRRRFHRAIVVARVGAWRVWATAPGSAVVLGTRGGRVRFIAVYDRHDRRQLAALVRRTLG